MGCIGRWLCCTLCACLIPLENSAVKVSIRDSHLEVVQGDGVLLPCSFITMHPLSRLNIIWTLAPFSSPQSPIQVIVYDHGQVIEEPSLIGRVAFAGLPWTADITLNDTRTSDAGVYRCMVNNPPEVGDPGIEELVLSVLAPPSLPVCQWEGGMEPGGSITLSCTVAEGLPTPHLRWDKLSPEESSLPINMDGERSGWVQIVNVSSQTSGLYRCSATNLLATQNCYVNLSIYTAEDTSPWILQGVLLTLSMSLLLLTLLLLLLWLRRTGQDGHRQRRAAGGAELRCSPTKTKRSFV